MSPDPPTPDLEVLLADVANPQRPPRRIACPGVLVAGRARTSNLVLPADDRHAAKIHFLVELGPAFCRLTNHSDQGTLVNGMLVKDTPCDLRHGDLVKAGNSVFRVEVLRRGVPAELAPSPTVVGPRSSFLLLEDTTGPAEEAPPAPPSPPIEVHPPGYRLLQPLGTGGMGTVWLAEDRAGQRVACKVVRPDKALDPETCARFRRETNHLRDLRHRNIVGFREAGELHGLLYLVMEYVPGSSLAELLRRQGPFAVGRAVRLMCQVLQALGEAHNNGVVHRDVKPSNILVQAGPGGEEVRLADFGLAKAYQSAEVGQSLTLPGVIGGTLAFAAPEMVSDFRRAGPLADQYAAAATLYNLLTGCHVHDAGNAVQMLDRIRTCDAVPLGRRRAGLPDGLVSAVHRALEREPRLRFPTVHALHATLAPYAD
jgi:serine/threonine-protein kinase